MELNREGDVGNMSMNISRAWGTNWESDENSLRTRENGKENTSPPPTQNPNGKKSGHLSACRASFFSSQNYWSPF
jgi:hypothetical protein